MNAVGVPETAKAARVLRRERVVVGVQGDDASLEALHWAARHARGTGGEIEALMAWELVEPPRQLTGDIQEVADAVISDLRWALETIVDRSEIAATPGVRVSTTIVTAPAKAAMADAVDRADLLVLGSAHHAAALAALSVSRQMAASASCPVALVPVLDEAANDGVFEGAVEGDFLVVGMDGSPQSFDAFAWATAEAARRRLPLRVVTVSPTAEALDAVTATIATRLRAHKPALPVDISLVTRAGDPGAVLLEEARGAEALVLGQHGSGTIRRRLPSLGSVSRWCVAHLVSPVVIVPRRPKSRR
jgi:nucleotide-binding universal stress UspA family protein